MIVPEGRNGKKRAAEEMESTARLLELVRQGDLTARDRLLRRYLPLLSRWAHGRLPTYARGMAETDDLVQCVLIRALQRLSQFEPRREGAFLAYLRQILLNEIRGEIRKAKRRPETVPISEELAMNGHSPLEETIGSETLRRYEEALAQLSQDHREAIVVRVEMGFQFDEVALALGIPTANAARMRVSRALLLLSSHMAEAGGADMKSKLV
jgi:RNA polymerase sigma factor (sigma-70 family)